MRWVEVRIACAFGALGCLGWAAWLAFDWADHADSTCGSLFHYKGAGDPCARIAHGRILWLAVAIALALTLSAFAAVRRSAPFEHTA